MIEKLGALEYIRTRRSQTEDTSSLAFTSGKELREKTNEVIECVNTLCEENNIHEKQIDELQMKVDVLFSRFDMISLALEKKNARPHKEQQDWLGHIVEYGNADDGFKYGILTNIDDTFSAFPYEIDNGRDAAADCWLPDESLFYKREEK